VAINPLSKIKIGLRKAIDLRVSQRFETERELMMEINNSLTVINLAYADKISALEKLVEKLDRRLIAVEKSK
jgi:hypothetical protein